jgi:ABC-type transporter MlaC component
MIDLKFRRIRSFVFAASVLSMLALSSVAFADDPQSFVQGEQTKLIALLHQTASAQRDTQVNQLLDGLVDYDELARRAFGEPCPAAIPSCTDHWAAFTDAQKTEVKGLLKQLVIKNYRKNLEKTLDYDITYKGTKADGDETSVRTEAKPRLKPRDPAVQVDYVVKMMGGHLKVVDIVTEHSSLTKNYYTSFHNFLTTDGQGYPKVVDVLQKNIAKP